MQAAILGALRLDSDRSERQRGAAEKSPAPNGPTRGTSALGLGGQEIARQRQCCIVPSLKQTGLLFARRSALLLALRQRQDSVAEAFARSAQTAQAIDNRAREPDIALAPLTTPASKLTLPKGIVRAIASKAAWLMAMRIIRRILSPNQDDSSLSRE
jgi:hypothetical protein